MASESIEELLQQAVQRCQGPHTPPRLAAALEHAVFPGGRRVRPRLLLAVAAATGGKSAAQPAQGAAVAVELLHCASLVHDDLPCFDDAPTRRGRPSVHAAFGEALAVLTGDGLIVAAFEALAHGCASRVDLLPTLLTTVAAGVGATRGIVAGQAWESEATVDVRAYHRQKTGALFEVAIAAGAIAGGDDPEAWAPLARAVGDAYQLADDIHDHFGNEALLGKPVGQDAAHGRPNAVAVLGISRAAERLGGLLASLPGAVPPCPGRETLVDGVTALACELSEAFVGRASAAGLPTLAVHETQRLHA